MLSLRKVWMVLLALTLTAVWAAPTVAAPLPEPKGVSEDDTKWLIGDAELIFKLNIKQLMASDLMKKGGADMLKEAIKSNEQAKTLLEAAGLDVTKDVDTVLASAVGSSAKDTKALVVIRGKFDQDKVHEALKKREDVKLSKDGTTQLYELPVQEQTMVAAFADRNTIVMTQNKDATVDALKVGGKKAATLNKNMKAALGKFTGKESMAVALVINAEMKKQIANTPRAGESLSKLQTLTASVTITDAVALNVTGITEDSKAASTLGKLLEGLKAAAGLAGDDVPAAALDIISAVKVLAAKETLTIDLKVTKEMIEKATKGG